MRQFSGRYCFESGVAFLRAAALMNMGKNMELNAKLEDVQAILKIFTAKNPDITTKEISDQLLTINAILGADIARAEPEPKQAVKQIGADLAKRVQFFLDEYSA